MKDATTMLYSDYGVIPADSEGIMLWVNKINNRIIDMFTMSAILQDEIGDCFVWKTDATYSPFYWHTFKYTDTKIDVFVLFDENNYNRATIGCVARVNKKVCFVRTYRYNVDINSDCLFIWQSIDKLLDDMIDKIIEHHFNAVSLEAPHSEWVVNCGDGTMCSVNHKKERVQTMYKRLQYELDTWK